MSCELKYKEQINEQINTIAIGKSSKIRRVGDRIIIPLTDNIRNVNATYQVAVDKAKRINALYDSKFGPLVSIDSSNLDSTILNVHIPTKLLRGIAVVNEEISMEEYQEAIAEEARLARIENKQYLFEGLRGDNSQQFFDMYGQHYSSVEEMAEAVYSELAELEEADNAIGNTLFIEPQYGNYITEKEKLLKKVQTTIDKLYTEKRIDRNKSVNGKISRLTTIKENLEKDIASFTKAPDKFEAVKEFFEKDINLIRDLLATPTLENLFLSQDIFKFIKESADINNVMNKIFKSEPGKAYELKVEELIRELNQDIAFIQKDIDDALDKEFLNLLEKYENNLSQLYPGKNLDEIKEELLSNLQDIHWAESKFLTVDENIKSESDILAQMLRVEYETIHEGEKSRSQAVIQKIDGLLSGVMKEMRTLGMEYETKLGKGLDFSFLYQQDEKGNKEPQLIGKFSKAWQNFLYKGTKDFNKKVFEARQQKAWADLETTLTNRFNDLNDKTEFINPGLLHEILNEPEYQEFKNGSSQDAETYKSALISRIGLEEYENMLEQQRNHLDSFIEERNALIQSKLQQEEVFDIKDLSESGRSNLDLSIRRLNPNEFYKAYSEGRKNMIEYQFGTQMNEKPAYLKYNSFIPKRNTSLSLSTNFFDRRFEEIEANPVLYNFWKAIREGVLTVNENLIDSNLGLNKNSILLFKKQFREKLIKKEWKEVIKMGLGQFTNIKQFIKNQISSKDVDFTDTGEILLPHQIKSFNGAVKRDYDLMLTDLANMLGTAVRSGTEISWINLTIQQAQQLIDIVGAENQIDFLKQIKLYKGTFKVAALRIFSQRRVMEEQTLDLPTMLKAQLEMSAEHKTRVTAKGNLDVIMQKSRNVLGRKKRRESEENTENAFYNKDRVNAQDRQNFFFKQVVLNDKGDPAWGNISTQLKRLMKSDDINFIGRHFYKNYTKEEKAIYDSANTRIETLEKEILTATETQLPALYNELAELQSRLRMLGKDYLGSAIFNSAFNKLNIMVNMGFSLVTPINNYFNAHIFLFNRDGEFWTKGNINLAWHYVNQNKRRYLSPAYKESWKKMGAFIKQLNIIQDGTNELQRAEENTSFLDKGILHPMYGTELAEWYNQVPGILSMAMDLEITNPTTGETVPLFDGKDFPAHHLVDGVFTLKDEFRTPENIKAFESISSDGMIQWKLQVNDMIRSLNGDYSSTGVTRIKGGVIGKQIMQYKTWLPRYLSNRFAYKQKSLLTGEERTGYTIAPLVNPKTSVAAGLTSLTTLAVGALSGPSALFMLPAVAPILGMGLALKLIKQNKVSLDVSEIVNIREQLKYFAKATTIGLLETPVNFVGGAFGKKTILDLDSGFKGKLTSREQKDLMLLAKHMQFSISILLMRLIIQAMIGDNEEEEPKGKAGSAQRARWEAQQIEKKENTKLYNFLENFLTARHQELNLANDPVSAMSTMGSKNGLESTTTKLSKTIATTAGALFFPDEDIIMQGEKAGQSKAGNGWRKMLLPTPVRGAGQDNWALGFESMLEKEWQNNDFTDKVFDSDYKIDKKEATKARKARALQIIEEYEETKGIDFQELEPGKQDRIKKNAQKKAKKEKPNPKRSAYDEEQEKKES